jgi:hypothetical protein
MYKKAISCTASLQLKLLMHRRAEQSTGSMSVWNCCFTGFARLVAGTRIALLLHWWLCYSNWVDHWAGTAQPKF